MVAFVSIGHLSMDRIWVGRGESGGLQGLFGEIKKEMPMEELKYKILKVV